MKAAAPTAATSNATFNLACTLVCITALGGCMVNGTSTVTRGMSMRVAALGLAIFCALLWGATPGETQAAGADWPDFAGSAAGTRYTPLAQITSANVGRLQL